jgi:hypothetical protein
MAASDLTTINDVKSYLSGQGNAIGNTDDALLNRLITAASGLLCRLMNRDAGLCPSASYTEYFDGLGQDVYFPANFPVTAISSIQVGLTVIPASSDGISAAGWVLRDDAIYLLGSYRFTKGRQNCKVIYTGGYANTAAVPPEIAQACVELVARKYRRRKSINLISEGIAGAQTQFTQKDATDDIMQAIAQYTRRFPF